MSFKYLLLLLLTVFSLTSCAALSDNAENTVQAESMRNLGEAYLAAGNPTLALRELLKANALNNKDPFTHNSLGLAYLSKGVADKAVIHFKKAIELNPEYAPAINNLGTAYISTKNWDKAIEVLTPLTQNILYTTPHFAESNLAFAYLNKKEYSKAERHYKNSLDFSPNYITGLRGLSIVYRLTGQLKKSLAMIDKAIANSPKNSELYIQKGRTLELLGEKNLAKEAYLKAISLGNDYIIEIAEDAILKL